MFDTTLVACQCQLRVRLQLATQACCEVTCRGLGSTGSCQWGQPGDKCGVLCRARLRRHAGGTSPVFQQRPELLGCRDHRRARPARVYCGHANHFGSKPVAQRNAQTARIADRILGKPARAGQITHLSDWSVCSRCVGSAVTFTMTRTRALPVTPGSSSRVKT